MGFRTISGHVYRRVQMFARWISLFLFFSFFFSPFSLPRRCVFFGHFATLFFFFFFLHFPRSTLSRFPAGPSPFLVSLMFRNPFFFFFPRSHPRGIHVLAARARGRKDRPKRRAVHPILRRPDK